MVDELTQQLLTGTYTLAVRCTVVDGTDLATVLHDATAAFGDGDVDMDRLRTVPRIGNMQLEDGLDGLYQARGVSSWTWAGRLWRLERGALVNGVELLVPLMTGLVTTPPTEVHGDPTVAFQISSRLRLLNANFPEPFVITAGMRANDVVLGVGALGGLGTDPALYVLNDGGAVAISDRVFTEDDNMLTALHDWLYAQSLVLTDDGIGRTVLYPFVDPSTTPARWTFDATSDAITTYMARQPKPPEQFYNRANVVGVGPDHYPIEAEARDMNPLSPTYNPPNGSGPLGDRPQKRFITADLHDQGSCNALALRRLYEGGLFDEGVTLRGVPIPGVEMNHVADLVGASANDRYLLDTVHMPMRAAEMTASTRRVRSLVAP